MYNIIPLILILISLSVIIVIVVRKFSVLANLDVDNIQLEKETRFKERIVSTRFRRYFMKHYSRVSKLIEPIGEWVNNFLKSRFQKLLEIKENYKDNKNAKLISVEQKIDELFLGFFELKNNENWDEAEKKLIEIISLDSKNIKAFRNLGRLYLERKNYIEAKQTFEHVLRLLENEEDVQNYLIKIAKGGSVNGFENNLIVGQLPAIYFDLSLAEKSVGNLEGAIINLKKALSIEPNNPRYLDTLLDISIIKKDKGLALDVLEKLKKVNPENKKLVEFDKKIRVL